jgi:AbiU2
MQKDKSEEYLKRLQDRMFRAFHIYLAWKALKTSMFIPMRGKEEVERRVEIMNRYLGGGIFNAFIISLEVTFVLEVKKFFEKRPDSLGIYDFDNVINEGSKKQIRDIVAKPEVQATFEMIEVLRNKLFAHDEKIMAERKMPAITAIDDLFKSLQEILNIISKDITSAYMVWDHLSDDVEPAISYLLDNLERGEKKRLDDIQKG